MASQIDAPNQWREFLGLYKEYISVSRYDNSHY